MKKVILITALVASMVATAQEDSNNTDNRADSGVSRERVVTDRSGNVAPVGLQPFVTGDIGYTDRNNSNNSRVEGMPSSLKLMGSYYLPNTLAVFDAGYGWQNVDFSQIDAQDSSINTGVLELASRYQFTNRWQLGAVYNQFFNEGNNFGATQADAMFGGVQALKEFGFGGNYLARIGGRFMTSLNVGGENVNMALIDLQLGYRTNL